MKVQRGGSLLVRRQPAGAEAACWCGGSLLVEAACWCGGSLLVQRQPACFERVLGDSAVPCECR